jgi:hypothetical protein
MLCSMKYSVLIFSTAVPSFAFDGLLSRAAIILTFARASRIQLSEWFQRTSRDGNDDELWTSRFDIQEDSGYHKGYSF